MSPPTAYLRNRKERHSLGHECSGNARQRQCRYQPHCMVLSTAAPSTGSSRAFSAVIEYRTTPHHEYPAAAGWNQHPASIRTGSSRGVGGLSSGLRPPSPSPPSLHQPSLLTYCFPLSFHCLTLPFTVLSLPILALPFTAFHCPFTVLSLPGVGGRTKGVDREEQAGRSFTGGREQPEGDVAQRGHEGRHHEVRLATHTHTPQNIA